MRRAALLVLALLSLHTVPLGNALTAAEPAAPPNAAPQAAPAVASPLSPADSLKRFVLPPGLRIELVAAEPEIVDPVEARFDEDGRLWVVEMRDYPNPPAPGEPAKSRIKLLEDRDGDGRYETATIFADELLFATGIQPWQGGVVVTLSGKIMYMRDTDGDGRADVKEIWFTGFAEENPQLRVNHPRWALDNHIYVASGLRGGKVINTQRPKDEPIDLRNRDLRFDPRTFAAEPVTGVGQFGMTFDDFGRRFICSNRNPLIHVVLEERYLRRNPFFTVPALVNDVAAAGEASRVYPISQQWTTSITHANQFTAACGVHLYRGDQLADEYYGNSFTCEPTGNLVHREIVEPDGATFKSKPAYADREFLASDDTWFRPVNVETGPDGALYIVDMYRAVIEHPQFMPAELKTRPDLRWGDDRGRIYRIVATDRPLRREKLELSKLRPFELVKFLVHKNAWQRETAARLIYSGKNPNLRDLVTESDVAKQVVKSELAVSRAQSLWTLYGISDQNAQDVVVALKDPAPGVREQAILILGKHAGEPGGNGTLIGIANESNPRTRFQFALELGSAKHIRGGTDYKSSPDEFWQRPAELMEKIGLSSDDIWTRRAVISAPPERVRLLLIRLLERRNATESPGYITFLRDVARVVGAEGDVEAIANALRLVDTNAEQIDDSTHLALLTGLAQGMRSKGTSLAVFVTKNLPKYPQLRHVTLTPFQLASELAHDTATPAVLRNEAIDLLAEGPYETVAPVLIELVTTAPDHTLRQRAVTAYALLRDPRVGPVLLENLEGQAPALRGAMLDVLLSQSERTNLLLDALEAKRLKPGELGQVRVNRLAAHRDPAIQKRAKELLAASLPADRQQALEKYQAALTLEGEPRRGKEVFRKNCAVCHKVNGVGVDVGPSIADTYNKKVEQLLADILQPSRAIDNNFVSYAVTTTDGTSFAGIIVAETAGSVTLKLPEAKTVSLLRSDIDELRSTGQSLMPDGLEKNISLQEMADCLSFLKNWRYLDTVVPGVSPVGK